MNIAVLEKKVSTLTAIQLQSVDSYIDFLLYQNEKDVCNERKPLDFSKYDTSTHIWNEDAQNFVSRLRENDRF